MAAARNLTAEGSRPPWDLEKAAATETEEEDSPTTKRPRSEGRFPLSRWELTAAIGIFVVCSIGLFCIYMAMPKSEYSHLKLPRNVSDLRSVKRQRQQTSSDMDLGTPPPTDMPTVHPDPYGGWYPAPFPYPTQTGHFTSYPPPPPPFGTYPTMPPFGTYPPPQSPYYPGQTSTSHQTPSGSADTYGMDFANQLFQTSYYPQQDTGGGSSSRRSV